MVVLFLHTFDVCTHIAPTGLTLALPVDLFLILLRALADTSSTSPRSKLPFPLVLVGLTQLLQLLVGWLLTLIAIFRYLKKKQIRDWLHVIASGPSGYELKYFQLEQEADDDAEGDE